MEGHYVLYYTGKEGSGFLCALFHKGKATGVEAAGGIISGSYTLNDDGMMLDIVFNFEPGTSLVTGQTLEQGLQIPFSLKIAKETFTGATQLADFPTGKVNFRMEKLTSL